MLLFKHVHYYSFIEGGTWEESDVVKLRSTKMYRTKSYPRFLYNFSHTIMLRHANTSLYTIAWAHEPASYFPCEVIDASNYQFSSISLVSGKKSYNRNRSNIKVTELSPLPNNCNFRWNYQICKSKTLPWIWAYILNVDTRGFIDCNMLRSIAGKTYHINLNLSFMKHALFLCWQETN